jgi:hypothetical protein
MTWLLKCHPGLVQTAHGVADAPAGQYLKTGDVDAHGGRGTAEWTDVPADAIHFATPGAAMEFWRRPSTVSPIRGDGRPNRPLTVFTVEVVRADS